MRARGGSASHTQKDAMDYSEEIRVVRMIYIYINREALPLRHISDFPLKVGFYAVINPWSDYIQPNRVPKCECVVMLIKT